MTAVTTGHPASGTDIAALRHQVRDLTARWRDQGHYAPRSDNWMRGFDPDFSRELARLGLLGLAWPAEYGGGLGHVARLAVTEEPLRAGAPVAAHWIGERQLGPAVFRNGSPALRAEILPLIARAEAQGRRERAHAPSPWHRRLSRPGQHGPSCLPPTDRSMFFGG